MREVYENELNGGPRPERRGLEGHKHELEEWNELQFVWDMSSVLQKHTGERWHKTFDQARFLIGTLKNLELLSSSEYTPSTPEVFFEENKQEDHENTGI